MAARNRTNPCPAQSRAALPRPSIALLFACIAASALTSGAVAEPTSITLPGEATYPESITSTADGTLYVSSFASGGVVRVKPGAREGENWIAPGAFETRSTFGVLADEARGIFWVCSNDLSALGIKGPSEVKGAFLKGFDLKTGEGRISAPFPVSPAICNDIALGPDGSAYVTNTLGPHILWLKPGSQSLKVWKTGQNERNAPPDTHKRTKHELMRL